MPAPTTRQVTEMASYVYENVEKKAKHVGFKRRPYWKWLNGRAKVTDATQGVVGIRLFTDSEVEVRQFQGADILEAEEIYNDFDLTFSLTQHNVAIKWVHERLKNMGFRVKPNGARGMRFARMNAREAKVIINFMAEQFKAMFNAWHRSLDRLYHLDGSQSALAPIGLDGIIPLSISPGDTYGGKPRDAEELTPVIKLDATYGAGGSLPSELDDAIFEANVNTEELGTNGIDVAFCGRRFMQKYKEYARLNGWEIQVPPENVNGLDLIIPDDACMIGGVPLIVDPTFAVLDTLYAPSTLWTNRCYLKNSETWQFYHPDGELMEESYPLDDPRVRATRADIDGRHVPVCEYPAANAVVTVTAS